MKVKRKGQSMISFEKAQEILLNHELIAAYKNEVELAQLWEVGGRVLAESIDAGEDVPPFDRSPVDGYAVCAADTAKAAEDNIITLHVIDSIFAGTTTIKRLEPGKTMKIFTGAPLPDYADAIIKSEDVHKIVSNGMVEHISLIKPVSAGEQVAFKGEDIKAGQTLLRRNKLISPAHMGILATMGVDPVPVFKKPKIGIFSTGNELVPVESSAEHGQLRASNLYTLAGIVRLAGCEPVNLGITKDSVSEILEVYNKAKEMKIPLVISTGGTASGDKDLIKEAMIKFVSSRLFNKVAIRPGAPVVVSETEQQLLIGLSGNPAGSTVSALTLLLPVLSKLAGSVKELERVTASLITPIFRRGGLRAFQWGSCLETSQGLQVEQYDNQHCGAVKSFASSNCLIDVPAGRVEISAGDTVKILKFFFQTL